MGNKPAYTIEEQLDLLKNRGMTIRNEENASHFLRNIIAHHSRLWSRNMVKRPTVNIKNPPLPWLKGSLDRNQWKKPFLIISCMIYLCNKVTPGHQLKPKIKELFSNNESILLFIFEALNLKNITNDYRGILATVY